MIRIDGSRGEGGGQVLRTALALSARLGEPVEVDHVRARRPKPGLRPQHLTVLRGLAAICEAEVEGGEVGSSRVVFRPSESRGGEFEMDAGTAGSIPLMVQGILPAVLERGARVVVKGGTDVPLAPTLDYVRYVFLRHLGRFGADVSLRLWRRGFVPRGRGAVLLEAGPAKLRPPGLMSGPGPSRAVVRIAYSRLDRRIPRRVGGAFRDSLVASGHGDLLGPDPPSESVEERAEDPGIAVTALLEGGRILGCAKLGEKGVSSETLGAAVARSLAADLDAGVEVDEHSADQILLYGALAPPLEFTTRSETDHLRTNAWVVEQMTGVRVGVEKRTDGLGVLVRVG